MKAKIIVLGFVLVLLMSEMLAGMSATACLQKRCVDEYKYSKRQLIKEDQTEI
jgi:hypothetical protein